MKNLLLLGIVLVCTSFFQQEQYYVTFIKGTVFLEKSTIALKLGDKLSPSDKIVFKDQQSKLVCISPGKGRFELSPQKVNAAGKSELIAVLKNNLVPAASTYQLSTRSIFFEGYDPAVYFRSPETGDRILLVNGLAIPVLQSYKTDATNFFFVQWERGTSVVTRKIPYTAKGIYFDHTVFGTEETWDKMKKVKLCYQTNVSGTPKSSVLSVFVPVLVDTAELLGQINVLIVHSGITDKKKLTDLITTHFYEQYGKIGTEYLAMIQ